MREGVPIGVLSLAREEPGPRLAIGEAVQLSFDSPHLNFFDPDTGEDLHHAPRAYEDCEAACYDCLLS